jgi:hypothetical protein
MSIQEQLNADLKEAMKARDAVRLDVVRMMKTALKNFEIEKMKELTDADSLEVLGREMKKLKDAVEQFRAGGRADLVEKTEQEMKLIAAYLPAALTEDEIKAIIVIKIATAGDVTAKDFGRIMKEVSADTKGRADGGTVSRLVKEALGS